MHLTPTALLLALVSPLISASHSSSLPPRRHHRPIPLPLRLHHSLKDSYAHGRIHLSKRAAVDDLFCGIGVLSSCPDSGSGGSSSSPGIDTDSDVNNCGRLGFVCPSPFANGIGTALCQAGTCVTSCPTGYTYTTAGCLDTRSDPSNCGSVGKTCPSSYDNGTGSTCSEGLCGPVSCDEGYEFDAGAQRCEATSSSSTTTSSTSSAPSSITTTTTTTTSSTSSAASTSSSSASSTSSSSSPAESSFSSTPIAAPSSTTTTPARPEPSSSPTSNEAPLGAASASARARARARLAKRQHSLSSLSPCPRGLTACPISRSLFFQPSALFSPSSSFRPEEKEEDYECIDISLEVESCGGCSSLGEGRNCAKIERARSVGCGEGRCVVFACEKGWRPDERAEGCVRLYGGEGLRYRAPTLPQRLRR